MSGAPSTATAAAGRRGREPPRPSSAARSTVAPALSTIATTPTATGPISRASSATTATTTGSGGGGSAAAAGRTRPGAGTGGSSLLPPEKGKECDLGAVGDLHGSVLLQATAVDEDAGLGEAAGEEVAEAVAQTVEQGRQEGGIDRDLAHPGSLAEGREQAHAHRHRLPP